MLLPPHTKQQIYNRIKNLRKWKADPILLEKNTAIAKKKPASQDSKAIIHENPTQDPGSDYGRQKRGCRELMAQYAEKHGFDTRFAVLPGVLHDNAVWGNGTTEYALDALAALKAAAGTDMTPSLSGAPNSRRISERAWVFEVGLWQM